MGQPLGCTICTRGPSLLREQRCFPWLEELQEINYSAARAGHGMQRTGHLPSGLSPRIRSAFMDLQEADVD